jgi:hypothetical protein
MATAGEIMATNPALVRSSDGEDLAEALPVGY